MSNIRLNPSQRVAANCLDTSVILCAGAGCGKTATLVERYVAILDGRLADVSQIAAITFTEKAANELKSRIRSRIADLGREAAAPAERAFWRSQLFALESAEIGTIHGFCGNVIREFPVEAGAGPGFGVIEAGDAETLLDESVHSAVVSAVESGFEPIVELLASFEFSSLCEMLVEAVENRETLRVIRAAVFDRRKSPSAVADALRERGLAVARILAARRLSSVEFEKAVALLGAARGPAGDAMERKRDDFIAAHNDWAGSDAPEIELHAVAMRDAIKDMRGGSEKKWVQSGDGAAFALVKPALAAALRELKAASALFDAVAAEDWPARAAQIALFLQAFDSAAAAYRDAKRARGVLDFEDILIAARDLLRANDSAAATVAARCRFILVDEFQDTDHVQEEMISRLAEKGSNLFVVGDPEQSVYAFRGAQVEVFNKVRRDYASRGRGRHMSLTGNYRTLPHLLSFVNTLFSRAMPAGVSQPEWWISHERLEPARASSGRRVELIAAESPGGLDEARKFEAQAVARRILEITSEAPSAGGLSVYERNGGAESARPASPGDVAILLRSMSSVGVYERALQEVRIPYYTLAGSTFYARQEIKDVVNLLRFVVDGDDTLSLAGALRSPLFAVSDDYLAVLACQGRGIAGYFDGAEPPGGGPDADAFRRALSLVSELRRLRSRIRARELLDRVFAVTGFPAAVSMLFAGAQRVANVKALLAAADAFDAQGRGTLEQFVSRLSDLEQSEARESEAVVQAEKDDVVRIMTVHAAKGLEFPIVVVADLGRGRNARSSPLHIDRSLGIWLAVPGGEECPSLDIVKSVERDREEAEERRMFFVAATRARDHLILSGAMAGKPKGWLDLTFSLLDIDPAAPRDYDYDLATVEYSKVTEPSLLSVPRPQPLLALYDDVTSGKPLSGDMPAGAREVIDRVAPLPPGTGGVDRLTATGIAEFCRCPLKFELAHLRGLPADFVLADPEPPVRVPGHVVGTLLHRVLEEARQDETLVAALDRVLDEDPSYVAGAGVLRGECAPLLERFEASEVYKRMSGQGEREASFSFLFEDCLIEGKIDLLLPRGLVDFKSDDVAAADVDARAGEYRAQMDVYALAFARMKGAPPDKVTLCFLRPERVVEWPYGADGVKRAEMSLARVIAAVRLGPPFAPRLDCGGRCEYARLCALIFENRSTRGRGSPPQWV